MAKNTINQTQLKNNDGWQLCPQSATYASANSIVFTGATIDNTISKGMKLKLTNDGTVKYYTITAFGTSGVIDRAMLLSGPVALVSGAITNLYFSTEGNPYGITDGIWNTWSPTWTNLTLGNATQVARYQKIGTTVNAYIKLTLGSSSSVGSAPYFTLPIAASSNILPFSGAFLTIGQTTQNPAGTLTQGRIYLQSNGAALPVVCNASKTYMTDNALSATIPGTWANTNYLYIFITYEAA